MGYKTDFVRPGHILEMDEWEVEMFLLEFLWLLL